MRIIWINIFDLHKLRMLFYVTGYLGAPTCAMFVLAVFWYKVNEPVSFTFYVKSCTFCLYWYMLNIKTSMPDIIVNMPFKIMLFMRHTINMYIHVNCLLQGAFWGMLIAQVWGLVRFVLDLVYPVPGCGEEDTRPGIVKNFHPYYHTFSQILLAFLIAALISLIPSKSSRTKEEVSEGFQLYIQQQFTIPYHKYELL